MVIKEYYEQLYANNLNNFDETDKVSELQNIPRLNLKEIKNMNKPITGRGWNGKQKPPPLPIYPGQDGFTGEFYQTFK